MNAIEKTKKQIINGTLLLVVTLVISSCLDTEKNAWIRDIDNMSAQLNDIHQKMGALSQDSLQIIETEINANKLKIKSIYKEDTLTIDFGETMSRYNTIESKLPGIISRKLFLDSALTIEELQLQKLKKDMLEGVGKRNHYKDYVKKETVNFNLIQTEFNTFVEQRLFIQKEFAVLHPSVLDIIDELEQE